MLKVFTFPPVWGLPTPSAYGLKIETWLRMSGIDYEAVHIQQPLRTSTAREYFISIVLLIGYRLEYIANYSPRNGR